MEISHEVITILNEKDKYDKMKDIGTIKSNQEGKKIKATEL